MTFGHIFVSSSESRSPVVLRSSRKMHVPDQFLWVVRSAPARSTFMFLPVHLIIQSLSKQCLLTVYPSLVAWSFHRLVKDIVLIAKFAI